MAISKEERAAIKEGIFKEGVQGRSGGTWAAAAFGLLYGAAAGALIALVPVVFFGSALSWTFVGGAAATFAGIGALTGRTAGSENGSSAGAVSQGTAMVLEELRGVKKELRDVQRAQGLSVTNEPDQKPSASSPDQKPLFDWRVSLLSLGLGAAVGALIAVGTVAFGPEVSFIMEPLKKLGFSSAGQQILGTALLGAASFGIYSFNVPAITAKWHMTARSFISGRAFDGPEPKQALEQAVEIKTPQQAQDFSYREYLAKRTIEASPEIRTLS